tara:strand:+ start:1078 stop:2745 length:1668 start_codon:yes stop_codon:yes gene_type:complete
MLYFNNTANEMRVYDGANWIAATSAGNVSLILYEYTATAGQTTFSGSDDNSATLSYTVDNLQVVMNGVILDPSDFTATSGTSVVLAAGAAANDLINIYAYKSFTTADMVSKSAGGTFAGAVGFTGDVDIQGSAGATLKLTSTDTSGADTELLGQIDFVSSDSSTGSAGTQARIKGVYEDNGDSSGIAFITGASTGSSTPTITEKMRIRHEGHVGIGVSDVRHPLHISYSETGSIPTDHNIGAATDNKNYLGFHNTDNSATYSGLALETRTSGAARWLIANEWKTTYEGDLVFRARDGGSSGSEIVRFTSAGDIGISSSSPATYSAGHGMPTIALQGNSSTYNDRSGALVFISQDGSTGKTWMYQDTDMYIQSATNTNMIFYTNNTERMKILAGGNVDISAGHILLDSGYGIDFSATGDSSGTTTSEILDDYEEGTWLPFLGSNETFTERFGEYTKVGNVVHVQFRISINQINNGSTHVIYGLPYAAASNGRPMSGYVSYSSTSATNNYWLGFYVNSGQSYMTMVGKTTLGASVYNGIPFFGNGADLIGGMSYVVS